MVVRQVSTDLMVVLVVVLEEIQDQGQVMEAQLNQVNQEIVLDQETMVVQVEHILKVQEEAEEVLVVFVQMDLAERQVMVVQVQAHLLIQAKMLKQVWNFNGTKVLGIED